jgi:hypothetical protein
MAEPAISRSSMRLHHIDFQKNIPEEIADSLVHLYQSAFSVKEYFRIYHNAQELNAIAIYSNRPDPDHVIFYSISGKEATILNELFEIDAPCLNYLAKTIFERYPALHAIHINNFKGDIVDVPYPYKVWVVSADIILELPETMAEYRLRLGRRTKANMSYYYNKLRREFPDFSFSVATGEDIDPLTVGKIIEMNRSRMKSKKLRSAIDAELERKIIQFSGKYGVVATITLNGRLAAGTICYGVGNHCYADIIAHDENYNQYSIGRVCIYLFINALIERGYRFFHMGSGEYEYKERMLGRKHDVYSMSIFRSGIDKQIGLVRHARRHKYIKMATDLLKYRYLWRLRETFSKK